jgi:subtilisin family serine protease
MNEVNRSFPHIELRFAREGDALPPPRPKKSNTPTTQSNLNNRWGHGSKLKGSASGIISDWQEQLAERKEEEKPDLPESVPLILHIDPKVFDFDAEKLRGFGIELIAELEDGYIIGASADIQLTKLKKKIENFINQESGGGKVPEIWDILDKTKRPEYILSSELQTQWGQIEGDRIYVVDVGIACVGEKSQLKKHPQPKKYKRPENYLKAVNKWIDDRDTTYEQWDDLKSQREDEFELFVRGYQGELINIVDGEITTYSELPDSFSCRISISGKGLRDLVLNFPYVFDVSLPDDVGDDLAAKIQIEEIERSFDLEPPDPNAPKVCVIDSGIQEQHPLLRSAIVTNDSRSWVPSETNRTADFVKNGGHGTRVAGAVLYPNLVPTSGQQQAVCWLQNARVLDRNCYLDKVLFPPALISKIVKFYQGETGTRIFNHSIAGSTPCRTQYMSAWAAEIDNLSWQHDILFIVAAGNLPIDTNLGNSRLSIRDRLQQGKIYPDYLLSDSCRVPNPAQSFQSLTVGSVSLQTFRDLSRQSIAQQDYPSSFSCTGLGIWDSIKPEVVEYGGDLVSDGGTQPNLTYPPAVCPDLVRSTLNGGPMSARDTVGTSFAAPKVAHIAACLAAELPNESCLLYRALIVQSARFPDWVENTNFDLYSAIRLLGYGIPNLDRALGNSNNRITLIARGERRIAARQAQIYEVSLPDGLRSSGEDLDIRIEVTLSYKAQPRRTRRARRKYLSTWLDWECSKKGEVPERFLDRVLKEYDAPAEAEESESIFNWVLNKRKNWGQARNVSRQEGTLQKDWAIVKSYDLRESFCIAVVGHEGWNNDPNATVPYALVVSFEAVDTNIPIYTSIANVQVPVEIKSEVSIQI